MILSSGFSRTVNTFWSALVPLAQLLDTSRSILRQQWPLLKSVHCTLHDYHYEDKELDVAYAKFRADYCDKCPDRKPRAPDWTYSAEEQRLHEDRHRQQYE